MHIEVKRQTKKNIDLYVPLRNDVNIFYGDGEINELNINGDLIINTNITNSNFFCKNYDVFMKIDNIAHSYDDGFLKFLYMDNIILRMKKNKKYKIYKKLGLPDGKYRGDLLVCV
jgi:hypothetical protein